jgi:hypothetical protein
MHAGQARLEHKGPPDSRSGNGLQPYERLRQERPALAMMTPLDRAKTAIRWRLEMLSPYIGALHFVYLLVETVCCSVRVS